VPTFAEVGIAGVVLTAWSGVSAPAGTPAVIVTRINHAVHQAIERAAVRAKLEAQGGMVAVNSPAQYSQNFRDEITLTETMMKAARLDPQ
jgi:tripartite-type tricarboxylate transporter receptor subunit TctC